MRPLHCTAQQWQGLKASAFQHRLFKKNKNLQAPYRCSASCTMPRVSNMCSSFCLASVQQLVPSFFFSTAYSLYSTTACTSVQQLVSSVHSLYSSVQQLVSSVQQLVSSVQQLVFQLHCTCISCCCISCFMHLHHRFALGWSLLSGLGKCKALGLIYALVSQDAWYRIWSSNSTNILANVIIQRQVKLV